MKFLSNDFLLVLLVKVNENIANLQLIISIYTLLSFNQSQSERKKRQLITQYFRVPSRQFKTVILINRELNNSHYRFYLSKKYIHQT